MLRSPYVIVSNIITGGVVEELFPVTVSVRNPSIVAVLIMVSPDDNVFSRYPVTIMLPDCIAVSVPIFQKRFPHVAMVGAGAALTKDNPAGRLSTIDIPVIIVAPLFL